jgi:hypothetical protein
MPGARRHLVRTGFASAVPGPYSGALTITYVEAGLQNEACVPIKVTF